LGLMARFDCKIIMNAIQHGNHFRGTKNKRESK